MIEGLGPKLQQARLARGLTLDEAGRLTKIRPSKLAEIEAEDFSDFPSLAYARHIERDDQAIIDLPGYFATGGHRD